MEVRPLLRVVSLLLYFILSSVILIAPQPYDSQSTCCGFVLVTDNIDKNIRRSYQREHCQTQSLHYCHTCAVKNRIDVSGLSDKPAAREITVQSFIPNQEDLSLLLQDFEVLVSR